MSFSRGVGSSPLPMWSHLQPCHHLCVFNAMVFICLKVQDFFHLMFFFTRPRKDSLILDAFLKNVGYIVYNYITFTYIHLPRYPFWASTPRDAVSDHTLRLHPPCTIMKICEGGLGVCRSQRNGYIWNFRLKMIWRHRHFQESSCLSKKF